MMDGSINLIQLGGMLVAIIASAAVAKQQLKTLAESVESLSKKLADLTTDIDILQQKDSATQTSIANFRNILSPDNLERKSREAERLNSEISALKAELRTDICNIKHGLERIHSIHNGKHPPV